MELVRGLDNDVLLVFVISAGLCACLIKFAMKIMFRSSGLQHIHPEVVSEVRHLRYSRTVSADGESVASNDVDTCPICLDNISYGVETNCRHRFCGMCFYTYWEQRSLFSQPNCPVCRGQVRFLLKRFASEDREEPAVSGVEAHINQFNRRFSGNPVSWLDQLKDLPTLVCYGVRALFDGEGEGISWFLRLRLIILSLFVFFYVISPLDIFPESIVGVFGLLDDAMVCLVFLIYFAGHFRRRLATNT